MGIINESTEDYLETILLLSKKLPVVRAVDIVEELGYSKSSVSNALKNLREKDYITVEIHGYIYLTKSGLALAKSVYERHEWFTRWLINLGVDEETAEKDYITVEIHGYIYLTKSGLALAKSVYERHEWFTKWLINLGVDEETAEKDACQLEHALSEKSFKAIKKSINL